MILQSTFIPEANALDLSIINDGDQVLVTKSIRPVSIKKEISPAAIYPHIDAFLFGTMYTIKYVIMTERTSVGIYFTAYKVEKVEEKQDDKQ